MTVCLKHSDIKFPENGKILHNVMVAEHHIFYKSNSREIVEVDENCLKGMMNFLNNTRLFLLLF